MPKKIRIPQKSEKTSNVLHSNGISKSDIAKRLTEDFGILEGSQHRHDKNEDELIENMDDKALMLEIMREFIPIFKRIRKTKDPHAILKDLEPFSAKVLGQLLMTGKEKTRVAVAKDILDRTQGKPIERQINLNGDIHQMQDLEVDREILRILNKLGTRAIPALAGQLTTGSEEGIPSSPVE